MMSIKRTCDLTGGLTKYLISYKCLYIVKVSQVCNLNPFLLFLKRKKSDRLWLGISIGFAAVTDVEAF